MRKFGYQVGRWDLARYRERSPQDTFTALDREWSLLPDVWPGNAIATRLFTSWLPYKEADTFLEVGCGTGVTAVTAALQGCSRVCALDISPAAVENSRLNAVRHGVSERITILRSDLFSELGSSNGFDLIYWNSPFAEAPTDHLYESQLDYAVFDADYAMHQRYFAEAHRYMTDGARLFLGFSDTLGNSARLMDLATTAGFTGSVYQREVFSLPISVPGVETSGGDTDVDYTLYEFREA
ncbi:methyltransferase [Streptomyces sp. NBC_01614]|uniref:Methyltransferase n=1 Tax=Streptomyces machairae TaxID=3134109 RepID=A0ABU8UVS2_9ACTN